MCVDLSICCVVNYSLQRGVALVIISVHKTPKLVRIVRHLLLNFLDTIFTEDDSCVRYLNVESHQQEQCQLVVFCDILVAVGDVAHVTDC